MSNSLTRRSFLSTAVVAGVAPAAYASMRTEAMPKPKLLDAPPADHAILGAETHELWDYWQRLSAAKMSFWAMQPSRQGLLDRRNWKGAQDIEPAPKIPYLLECLKEGHNEKLTAVMDVLTHSLDFRPQGMYLQVRVDPDHECLVSTWPAFKAMDEVSERWLADAILKATEAVWISYHQQVKGMRCRDRPVVSLRVMTSDKARLVVGPTPSKSAFTTGLVTVPAYMFYVDSYGPASVAGPPSELLPAAWGNSTPFRPSACNLHLRRRNADST